MATIELELLDKLAEFRILHTLLCGYNAGALGNVNPALYCQSGVTYPCNALIQLLGVNMSSRVIYIRFPAHV